MNGINDTRGNQNFPASILLPEATKDYAKLKLQSSWWTWLSKLHEVDRKSGERWVVCGQREFSTVWVRRRPEGCKRVEELRELIVTSMYPPHSGAIGLSNY